MQNGMLDLQSFVSNSHRIPHSRLVEYVKQLGGGVVEICNTYHGVDKWGFEDECTVYLEFYVDGVRLRGYFHDMSSYDEREPPFARFSVAQEGDESA
jgi:hypothetical protein